MQISGINGMFGMGGAQRSSNTQSLNSLSKEASEANSMGMRDNDGDRDDFQARSTGKGSKVHVTA